MYFLFLSDTNVSDTNMSDTMRVDRGAIVC